MLYLSTGVLAHQMVRMAIPRVIPPRVILPVIVTEIPRRNNFIRIFARLERKLEENDEMSPVKRLTR